MTAVAVQGAVGRAMATKSTPPSTGSTELLAVTVTASGLANARSAAVCGAAGDGRSGEALALEGADVDGCRPAGRAGRCGDAGTVPAPMAGLPGSRAMVSVGPP